MKKKILILALLFLCSCSNSNFAMIKSLLMKMKFLYLRLNLNMTLVNLMIQELFILLLLRAIIHKLIYIDMLEIKFSILLMVMRFQFTIIKIFII